MPRLTKNCESHYFFLASQFSCFFTTNLIYIISLLSSRSGIEAGPLKWFLSELCQIDWILRDPPTVSLVRQIPPQLGTDPLGSWQHPWAYFLSYMEPHSTMVPTSLRKPTTCDMKWANVWTQLGQHCPFCPAVALLSLSPVPEILPNLAYPRSFNWRFQALCLGSPVYQAGAPPQNYGPSISYGHWLRWLNGD